MNWKNLFTSSSNMTPEEARQFMAVRLAADYQLLDVRRPTEYEQGHIPGCRLIPVKELSSRLTEVDRKMPVLVYCHSGVRSKAASQLLLGADFQEVYNISGGIVAWQGQKAAGPEEQGLEFFVDRDFSSAFVMAYAMEEGLRQLYLALVDRVVEARDRKVLERLARFEEGHKAQLRARFAPEGLADAALETEAGAVEGGFDQARMMAHFGPQIADVKDIFYLGMMLETQALDLYSRLGRLAGDEQSRELFEFLAEEEGKHLGYLADELDKRLKE